MLVHSLPIGLKAVQYIKIYGDELWIDSLFGFIMVDGEWIPYIGFIKMILMIISKII